MNNNDTGDIGADVVLGCILAAPRASLVELRMKSNGITSASAPSLAKALLGVTAISILDLRDNPIGPAGVANVVNMLATPGRPPMEMLGLTGCYAGNEGAKALAGFMVRTGCRRVLAGSNDIGATGARAIVRAVGLSPQIRALDLSHNSLGTKCAICLARMLAGPGFAIEDLNLEDISMGEEGAKHILAAFRKAGCRGKMRRLVLQNEDGYVESIMTRMKFTAEEKEVISIERDYWNY